MPTGQRTPRPASSAAATAAHSQRTLWEREAARLRGFLHRSTDAARKRRAQTRLATLESLIAGQERPSTTVKRKTSRRRASPDSVTGPTFADQHPGIPDLSPGKARDIAVMLCAGMTLIDTLPYVISDLPAAAADRLRIASAWATHPELQKAIDQHDGGSWFDLTPDQRQTIALDRHLASMAYWLATTPFANMSEDDRKKAKDAREALKAARDGDADTPLNSFMRDVMNGKVNLQSPLGLTPPQFPSSVS